MECTICGSTKLTPINALCAFTNKAIHRFKCSECELIFGPIDYINYPLSELIARYKRLYAGYSENDTTDWEVRTFMSLGPSKTGSYLNYGSGIWSRSHKIITELGYKLDCYDFSFDDRNKLNEHKKYDGVFSHNVIEHLQNPIETFKLFRSILKDDGVMSHSTSCYEYKYEYSIFHLHFLIGKSLQILSDKTGFTLNHFLNEPDYAIKVFKKA